MLESVGDPGAGAVVLFLGTVRDNSEAGRVDRIEYEAYEPMAEKSAREDRGEVRRKWPATKAVKIVHRVGDLAVGEVSVAVAVSSPHRAEAFEACRHAIEAIKHESPSGSGRGWRRGRGLGRGNPDRAKDWASARRGVRQEAQVPRKASLREKTKSISLHG